jgi:hypothetical protein
LCFFHELGHALIQTRNLPIAGSEEDAVDRFSAILASSIAGAAKADRKNDLGEHMITAAMLWFRSKDQAKLSRYWDEHPLNEQRYYNLVCILYGSDPERYSQYVVLAGLPAQRARSCPKEFMQAQDYWNRVLPSQGDSN